MSKSLEERKSALGNLFGELEKGRGFTLKPGFKYTFNEFPDNHEAKGEMSSKLYTNKGVEYKTIYLGIEKINGDGTFGPIQFKEVDARLQPFGLTENGDIANNQVLGEPSSSLGDLVQFIETGFQVKNLGKAHGFGGAAYTAPTEEEKAAALKWGSKLYPKAVNAVQLLNFVGL